MVPIVARTHFGIEGIECRRRKLARLPLGIQATHWLAHQAILNLLLLIPCAGMEA